MMIKEIFEIADSFKSEEKLFVFSLIVKAFDEIPKKNDLQREVVSQIGEYLGVIEPQIDVSFSSLRNIEKQEVHRVLLFFIYQLYYLGDDSLSFEDNDSFVEILDEFSLKRSEIKTIKNSMVENADIIVTISEIINQRKTFMTFDQLRKEISKFVCLKKSTGDNMSLPYYRKQQDFETLFAIDCMRKVKKHYEEQGMQLLKYYASSLQKITEYVVKSYEIGADNHSLDLIEEFKQLSMNDYKNVEYEIDYKGYVPFNHKIGCLDMATGKSSHEWSLDTIHAELLSWEIEKGMRRIEDSIFERYNKYVSEIVEYFSEEYKLEHKSNAIQMLLESLNVEHEFEGKKRIIEEARKNMDENEFRQFLLDNYVNNSPIVEGASEFGMINYVNGVVLFYAEFNSCKDVVNRETIMKIYAVSLSKNTTCLLEQANADGISIYFPSSVACIDRIYFLITFLRTSEDNYTMLLVFNTDKLSIENVMYDDNREDRRVYFFDNTSNLLLCERFLFEKNGDLFTGYKDYFGNVQKEIVVENICRDLYKEIDANLTGECLDDDVLIQKFLSLENGSFELFCKEVEKKNYIAMYLLGEIYANDNRINRGKDFVAANDLWLKGRKCNVLCRAKDLLCNPQRYSNDQIEDLINSVLQSKEKNTLYASMIYLLVKKGYVDCECLRCDIIEFLENEVNKNNWLACDFLAYEYCDKGDLLNTRKYLKKSVELGMYSSIDKLIDSYFTETGIDRVSYSQLQEVLKECNHVISMENMREELNNIENLLPQVDIYALDREKPASYSSLDYMKKFSTKGAAKNYFDSIYKKHCEYIKDSFKLKCQYYSGENGNYRKFINDNNANFISILKRIIILRAELDLPYINIEFDEYRKKIEEIAVNIGDSINVSNFSVENYVTHDFTEWGEGGLFSKKEYTDFPNSNGLESDFRKKLNEVATQMNGEIKSFAQVVKGQLISLN